jgi:hypothetical protein
LSAISCQNWGCSYHSDSNNADLNYMVWNWQNLPGIKVNNFVTGGTYMETLIMLWPMTKSLHDNSIP